MKRALVAPRSRFVSRIFGRIFGFSDFSGLGLDIGLPIRGFIQGTHVMLLNAGVRVLEPTHGPISRHFWSTWWSDFWSDFRIFGFLGFGSRYRPPDQGVHSGHPCDAFERRSKSSGAHPWPDFSTFLVHMVVGFLVTRNCMKFSGLILRFRDGQPYLQPSRGNHG